MEGRRNYHRSCWQWKVKIILQIKLCSSVDQIKRIIVLSMHRVHFANIRIRLDRGVGSHQNVTWRRENRLGGWTYFLWLKVSSRTRIGPEHSECAGSDYGKQEGKPWYDRQRQRDIMPGGYMLLTIMWKEKDFIVKSSDQGALEKMAQETKPRKQQ